MTTPSLSGFCRPGYSAVQAAFEDNFRQGEEGGARFSLVRGGEVVVDLWAGWADKAQTRPFEAQTLAPIFSTTKLIPALMIARLVEAGRLDYAQPVADLWPDFARNGKAAITLEQVMSHQAGLSGFLEPMSADLWFDTPAICERLAAMAPLWPPGQASGYHPTTYGFLTGEIFRRVDGRSLGQAFHEDLARPLDLDIWIGLPASEHARVAELTRPRGLARFGAQTPALKAAFQTAWAAPPGREEARWREAEIPSANGHASALSLARLMGCLAGDGWLDGEQVLSPAGIQDMARARCQGQDLVLPYEISWGAGVMRNEGLNIWGPGQETFGHAGWGGSCAFADPERQLAGAYVMTRQSADLIGDPRARRLIEAAYA